MSLLIRGGKPLRGTVRCDGAKNAALPIMEGAILSEDISIIDNVPHLRDVETMSNVLRSIGASVRVRGNSVLINPGKRLRNEAPYDLVRMMRASFLIMGLCSSAWCCFGASSRRMRHRPVPVDLHQGIPAMGAEISEGGFVKARADSFAS